MVVLCFLHRGRLSSRLRIRFWACGLSVEIDPAKPGNLSTKPCIFHRVEHHRMPSTKLEAVKVSESSGSVVQGLNLGSLLSDLL